MAKSRKRAEGQASAPSSTTQTDHPNANGSGAPDYDRIAQRAYELYLARGGSHGSDWEDWLAAERELMHAGGERSPGEDERHR